MQDKSVATPECDDMEPYKNVETRKHEYDSLNNSGGRDPVSLFRVCAVDLIKRDSHTSLWR